MTIFDRIRSRLTEPPSRTPLAPGSKAVVSLGPWANGPLLSSAGNSPQERAKAYLRAYRVGWFHKAGRKIANDISSLDWSVSEGDAEEGDDEETLERPDLMIPFEALPPIDQFQRLLERPNPSYTGRQLLHKTQVRLDFAGAAAWYLEGATSGLPTALYGISPTRLWPSLAKSGELIGWVMDANSPNPVAFDKREILWFTTGSEADDDVWGVSVVESVYSQVPLTEQMARHTSNVLTTGGRLAGMMWPKDRALTEDEYTDAMRAWRNVASDPDAGKRLLIFPEPMEYAAGASTPAEIGIPELAVLNRDEILTAFPLSPYQLGVPMPGGLNSAEMRREDRRDYWEGTIHPRADLLEETIQIGLLGLYEEAMGTTYDFEIGEPNLDDPPSILQKVAALRALTSAGFDETESVKVAGLSHVKFLGIPAPDPSLTSSVGDGNRQDNTQTQSAVVAKPTAKATKARDETVDLALSVVKRFLAEQRDRVIEDIRATYPASSPGQTERKSWVLKADPEWWDAQRENRLLREALSSVYLSAGTGSLQVVADQLDRIVPNRSVARIVADLTSYGGERITGINETTRNAIVRTLTTGATRGYSINQLVDGVPSEGFPGIREAALEAGGGAWDGYRAERIARTETMLSYNRGSLYGYREFAVRYVTALDGDGDDACAARAGSEFTVEEAMGIEDHPNGTLDWSPVTDKAWHDKSEPVATVPSIEIHPHIDVHMPEQPPAAITVNVEPTPINNTVTAAPPVVIDRTTTKGSGDFPEIMDVRVVASTLPPRKRKVTRGPNHLITEITEEDA